MQTIVKIYISAIEVSETGGIHEKLNAFALENLIVRLREIERHAILKT